MRTTWATTLAHGYDDDHDDDDATTRACAPRGFLTGIVAVAGARKRSKEFEVRAKFAREAPFDRNVEGQCVFEGFSKSARADFLLFCLNKSYVFIGLF